MVSLLALVLSKSVSIALIVGAIFLVGLLLFIIRNIDFWKKLIEVEKYQMEIETVLTFLIL